SLYGRTGGAATLAVGMANLFHKALPGLGEGWLGIWYHFALMFEALFILTTLDAGTRVGRYLLQDALGHAWRPLGDTRRLGPNLFASALVVALWGYFLLAAVYDPDGGIKALWPIFGIANQLLAATALCLATTIVLKMTLVRRQKAEGQRQKGTSPWLALVTLGPLLWLLTVTGTAAVQKVWHPDPRIGFHAGAEAALKKREEARAALTSLPADRVAAQNKAIGQLTRQAWNFRLNAAITKFFLVLVTAIFLISLREWVLLLARKKLAELRETPPVWLPDYAVAEGRPLNVLGLIALSLALLRELTGEADFRRAKELAAACPCPDPAHVRAAAGDPAAERALWVQTEEERYRQIRRCC
ncbi:MAG: carbon starvation CstA family protein, partial [Limisphaerales bacterium]